MNANDPLKPALDHYRQKRLALLDEIRRIDATIRQMEIDLGEPLSESRHAAPTDGYDLLAPEPPEKSPSLTGSPPGIRRDEFFGKTQSDAAKMYLGKVGHAVSMDELVEKLRAGGCKVGGANAKHTLYVSLVRNTRDFVPVGDGFIGLRSFYPGLKSASSKSIAKSKRGKARGKRKAKKLLVKKKGATKSPIHVETPAHKVVYQLLSDGELHSRADILQAGKVAGVMPIAILGLLKHAKDIERVGDNFRLRKVSRGEDKKIGNAS